MQLQLQQQHACRFMHAGSCMMGMLMMLHAGACLHADACTGMHDGHADDAACWRMPAWSMLMHARKFRISVYGLYVFNSEGTPVIKEPF